MARASKLCNHCPNLQPCPDHPKVAWASSTRSQRLPRGWSKLRLYILQRDPLCRICTTNVSREVDHIVPGDDHSPTNLQGVCVGCHREKTLSEAADARRRAT